MTPERLTLFDTTLRGPSARSRHGGEDGHTQESRRAPQGRRP